MTFPVDCIGVHARNGPQRHAATDLASGVRFTYSELDCHIGRLAALLAARGCAPGDRVAAIGRNSVWMVALHFACARAGFIFCPLNWRLHLDELRPLIGLAEPRLLLADDSPTARALAAVTPAESLAAFVEESRGAAAAAECARDLDRPSLILFTSGTSGIPKGVVLTERNLLQTAINFGVLTRVGSSSVFLCDTPMFHVIGLVTNVRPVLTQGGAIAVSDSFDAERTFRRLSDPELGVTHYVAVPQMIEGLRGAPGFEAAALRRLTALVSGGAPHAAPAIQAWLDDEVPLVLGFGMSEAGTVFGMSTELAVIRDKLGAAGIAGPLLETRVVDEQGRACGVHEPGELWLRGEGITPGYWRNPEETAKAIDAEGWFATGDIVRFDEDGFFWFVDRKKDMFISGGENVYPAEIEGALADYPGLRECALVGVPDPVWGEVGRLAIVAGPDCDEAGVLAFLRSRFAGYKTPKQVRRLEALPRTPTGKIQKSALRSMFAAEDAQAPR